MAIPEEIARLPKAMQALIKTQCKGDWSRVTIDKSGAITVHNRPQRTTATKAPAPATKAPAPKKTAPKKTAPKKTAPKKTAPPARVAPPPRIEPTTTPAPTPQVDAAVTKPVPVARPVRPPAKSQAKPRKVLPPPVTSTSPPPGLEHLKPQRVGRPIPTKKAATPPAPATPPATPPAPTPAEPEVVEPVIQAPPAPVAKPEPAAPSAHAEPEPLPKPVTPAPAAEPTKQAPWDRSRFNRTPLPPRRPRPTDHRPLPRPSLPREDVRLPSATITSNDVTEVVATLERNPTATFQEAVYTSLERQEIEDFHGRKWIILPGIEDGSDWEGQDYEGSAHRLQQAVTTGLPAVAPLLFHDDVTALHGIDLDEVEAAVRKPQRVEIAPETGVKKYPILKFWRGDVMTVVGFREPYLPKIIAAYIGGLGLPGGNHNATGGGGGRKTTGLPKNPKALVKRLAEAGADCTEEAGGKTHRVTFRGQDLGQVNTGPAVTSKDIENAWQRMRRRIEAIRMREDAPMRS